MSIFTTILYIIISFENLESKSIEFYIELGFEKQQYIIILYIVYVIVILFWSFSFVHKWKNNQRYLAAKLGQINYKEKERENPNFDGILRRSPINDELNEITFRTQCGRIGRLFISILTTSIFICLLIIVVVLLLFLKDYLQEQRVDYIVYIPS